MIKLVLNEYKLILFKLNWGRNDRMKNEKKCFCGNEKCKSQFHREIKSYSKYAKIMKLYSKIDKTIKNDLKSLQIKPFCRKGCSECCHQVFFISEVEFCVIIDYLLEHSKYSIDNIIQSSKEIMRYIKNNDPILYNNLNVNITGGNAKDFLDALTFTKDNHISKGCVFLNNDNACSIYKVRPLVCRTHGVAYTYKEESNIICSKLEVSNKNRNEFVDLTSYRTEINKLFEFKYNNKFIVRRPYPIFYWFYFLDKNNLDLINFRKTVFYNRYASMSETEMLESFVSTYGIN